MCGIYPNWLFGWGGGQTGDSLLRNVPTSLSDRTFATSHYKREYKDTVPINKAAPVLVNRIAHFHDLRWWSDLRFEPRCGFSSKFWF